MGYPVLNFIDLFPKALIGMAGLLNTGTAFM